MTGDASEDVLGPLMDEFLRRKRSGEHPSLSEYITRHPELEDEIRELFPAVAMMEQVESTAPEQPRVTRDGRTLQRLGDYRIIREIGRGGMGVVYEAIQESLGRHVAIKVLPWQSVSDERLVKRFQREARISAALHHTNIVPVYGVGEADGVHFLAMQFIRGQSLDSVLDELRRMSQPAGHRQTGPDVVADRSAFVSDEANGVEANGVKAAGESPSASDGPPIETFAACENGQPGPAVDSQQIARSLTHCPGELSAHEAISPARSDRVVDGNTSAAALGDTAPMLRSASALASSEHGHRRGEYYRKAARLMASVADAIDYAHSHGVIHRDVKPANLMIDLEGEIWVTDFGLAKAQESSPGADDTVVPEDLTHTGDLVGTIRYLAPERFQGVNNARCDIYSLGLTLHEFVTMRPAFAAPDRVALIQLITSGPPPSARRLAPDLPRDLETIISKATRTEPGQRYATAAKMAVDLRRFLEGKPIVARRTPLQERFILWCRRRPTVAALSGLVLSLFVVLAIGSSIAAIRLNNSLGRALAARRAEVLANRKATRSLFDAYVSQATAEVSGIESGRHFGTMSAVEQASRLLRQLDPPDADRLTLRNLAIHGLVLDDVQKDIHVRLEQPNTFHQKSGFDASLSHIALVDNDGRVIVRAVDSDEVIMRIPGRWQPAPLAYTRISSDNRFVVIHGTLTGDTCAMSLWDQQQQKFLLEEVETRLPEWGRCFAFSADGTRFVYATLKQVRVLDLPSTEVLRTWTPPGQTMHATFSPDGRTLVVDGGRGSLIVLDVASQKQLPIAVPARATDAEFSPDGRLLAASSGNNNIYVWDLVRPDEPLTVMKGHTSQARAVEFSPDGLLLASSGWDTTSRIWQPVIGRELCRVPGQIAAFSADGRRLGFEGAAAGFGRYRTNSTSVCRSIVQTSRAADVDDLQFHPSGQLLTFVGDDGLFVYHWPDAELIRHVNPLSDYTRCRFFDEGRRLLVTGVGGAVCYATQDLLQQKNPKPIAACRISATYPCDAAVAGDDESIIYLTADGKMHQLNSETLVDVKDPIPLAADHWFLTASPDGRFVVTSGKHSLFATIRDAVSGEVLHRHYESRSPGVWPQFSEDSRLLALSSLGKVEFLSTSDWQVVGEFELGELSIGRTAFSADGTMIAVQSRSAISLLDTERFAVLAEFVPRFGEPLCSVGPEMAAAMAFSEDSRCLAVGTRENSVHVWDLAAIHTRLQRLGLGWQDEGGLGPSTWGVSPDAERLPVAPHLASTSRPFAFPESADELRQRRLQELNQAVLDDPDAQQPRVTRAVFLKKQGDLKAALDEWTTLLQMYPEELTYRFYRGLIWQQMQPPDLISAAADYEYVLASEHSTAAQRLQANNYIAWFSIIGPPEICDADRALQLSQAAVELARTSIPDAVTYTENTLGWCLYRCGKYADAAEILARNADRRDNTSPVFDWLCLAACYHHLEQPENSQAAWHAAFTALPGVDSDDLTLLEALFREVGGQTGQSPPPAFVP